MTRTPTPLPPDAALDNDCPVVRDFLHALLLDILTGDLDPIVEGISARTLAFAPTHLARCRRCRAYAKAHPEDAGQVRLTDAEFLARYPAFASIRARRSRRRH